MTELIHQGGPTMLWILMLVVPGLALVILHIVLRRRWSLWCSVGVLTVILAIGFYGRMRGRTMTDEAVVSYDNVERDLIREQGYKEASRPLQLAGLVDAFLAVGVVIGQLRRQRR